MTVNLNQAGNHRAPSYRRNRRDLHFVDQELL